MLTRPSEPSKPKKRFDLSIGEFNRVAFYLDLKNDGMLKMLIYLYIFQVSDGIQVRDQQPGSIGGS